MLVGVDYLLVFDIYYFDIPQFWSAYAKQGFVWLMMIRHIIMQSFLMNHVKKSIGINNEIVNATTTILDRQEITPY